MKLLKPKDINKPWKVTLWLYGIDAVLRLPLKLSSPYFSSVNLFLMLRYLVFIIAIFLVSILYVKLINEAVNKPLRLRVSMHVALISLAAWLFFTSSIFGEFFASIFGGLVEGVLAAIATFLSVYFILPLGNRFMAKK